MRLLRLVDWPHDEPLWGEEDLTSRVRLAGAISGRWDGSRVAEVWWDLLHPPTAMLWTPPWRRHKRLCDERAMDALLAHRAPPASYTYCPTCSSWELRRRNPLFWLVLIFGEK